MTIQPLATKLYLDTARLGQLSQGARAAYTAFLDFASIEGGSSHFDDLVQGGYDGCCPDIQRQYPGLKFWLGIGQFENMTRNLIGCPTGSGVYLANRSSQLFALAAGLLSMRCKRIAVTDLEWPPYLAYLSRVDSLGRVWPLAHSHRSESQITVIPLREAILHDSASPDEICKTYWSVFMKNGCDGLLLSHVTYEGLHMPVQQIVETLPQSVVRFAVLDCAQAIGHVPPLEGGAGFDLLLGGYHKWLNSYHPVSFAVALRKRSDQQISRLHSAMLEDGTLDDGLAAYLAGIRNGDSCIHGETVLLSGLFSAAGSCTQTDVSPVRVARRFHDFQGRLALLDDAAHESAWEIPDLSPRLRSGIQLLRPRRETTRKPIPGVGRRLRRACQAAGVAMTGYDYGVLRASAPLEDPDPEALEAFREALKLAAEVAGAS